MLFLKRTREVWGCYGMPTGHFPCFPEPGSGLARGEWRIDCVVMAARAHSVGYGLLILVAASSTWASSGSPRAEPRVEPSAEALNKAFSAHRSRPWTFSPAAAESTRSLRTDTAWDLRHVETLSVRARILHRRHHLLRLRWLLTSRLGFYSAAQSAVVPSTGTEVLVSLRVAPSGAAVVPVGHQRPWDALAAAEIVAIELRAEVSGSAEPLTVELREPLVQRLPARAGEPFDRRLVDVRVEPPPPHIDAAAMLVFRVSPLPDDPFAADAEGDICVRMPDGRQALAFLDQPQMLTRDGWAVRCTAVGPSVYRAYLPSWPAGGNLSINCGAKGWQIPVADVPSSGRADASAPPSKEASDTSAAESRWEPPLEIPFPPPEDPLAKGFWGGAPRSWRLEDGVWRVAPLPDARTAWRPVPFWNEKWGSFSGWARPDFGLAARVDERMAAAARAHERRPLVLLDGENFTRHGIFTWASHPLNVENGGVLYGPGELLRTHEGFEYCRRVARYVLARWGRSRSVSSLLLTARLSTPGVAGFHERFAESLRGWLALCERPLYSLHPFAREPNTTLRVEGLEGQRQAVGGPWRAADPQPERLTVVTEGSGVEARSMLEVVARPGQMSVCAVKPYRFAAFPWDQPLPDDFSRADAMVFDVWLPSDAPADLRAGVHLCDRDGLWFQALLPGLLSPGGWTTCLVDLSGSNAHGLTAVGHRKAWTEYSRGRLTEIGLHVFSTHPEQKLRVRFADVRGVAFERIQAPAPRAIALLDQPLKHLKRGEIWEAHLQLDRAYGNPFDPSQVDLAALVKSPSGRTLRVPAFFDQPCARREGQPDGTEIVEPVGSERWTLRYRVLEEGPHQVTFELREGGSYRKTEQRMAPDRRFSAEGQPYQPVIRGRDSWVFSYEQNQPDGKRLVERVDFEPGTVVATLALPNGFVAAPDPAWRGFVRVDADRRNFRFDNGTPYYALGPCLRSPSDNRLPYIDPKWSREKIDHLGKRGTYQFDEYLAAFEKNGINWTRVWMSSWWCGLQWRRDWPGYGGIGRYNLQNAWRLDHVLKDAETRGIYVSLCLTNHGPVSRLIDTEWENNPYNRAMGGPLGSASEFFTRAEPQIGHMNQLRYVAARWGHSPAILTWDLFSELEFTEEYRPSVRWPRPDASPQNINQWHQKMARFLKDMDVNQHLIGSHYSRPIRGYHTLAVPEVDVAASNAYSAFEELAGGNMDAPAALAEFWAGNDDPKGFVRGYRTLNKPVLVEEQGRHWMGAETHDGRPHPHNTRDQLDADLHAGLWGSMVQPLSGATGYWWWLHLHFDDRYGEYKALANFVAGEDFRAAQGETPLEPHLLPVENDNNQLRARVRCSADRAYLWVYHAQVPLRAGVFPVVPNTRVRLPNLKAGAYQVEYWDTRKGERTSVANVNHGGGPLVLQLPPIEGDVAAKIKPAK